MKFIVLPIEDAKIIFSEKELETHRKSIDGSKVIIHEETLIEKQQAMGMTVLSSEETGQIEWTYPNYEYNSDELNSLLESDEWSNKEEETIEEQVVETAATTREDSIEVIDFVTHMKIENGKYYRENGVIYKCIQTSKLPISNKLSDLVGYYTEIVK